MLLAGVSAPVNGRDIAMKQPEDEEIGKGSIVDLMIAPLWALAFLLGIVHVEPRISGKRDVFLAIGFWGTVVVVVGACFWAATR